MSLSRDELEKLRIWLDHDPVGNAWVIHRVYHSDQVPKVLADDLDNPRAVVAFDSEHERLVLTAEDPDRLRELLDRLPTGAYHFSAVDLDLIPAMQAVMDVEIEEPTWLFNMKREDFRPTSVTETDPVRPEHAEMIAQRWLDTEATDYVRSRIDTGMTAGIYVEGELVAWDMTHLETDDVVMLGFLHVRTPYRGRGYAKTVATAMLKEVFASGKMPICHVFQDNEGSINLSEKMGFRKVKKQVWGTAKKV